MNTGEMPSASAGHITPAICDSGSGSDYGKNRLRHCRNYSDENGVIKPVNEWMLALRKKCDETGALLILDEIRWFGRIGTQWGLNRME
jgi:hypothetical protein